MKQISTSLTSKLRTDSIIERDYIIFSGETTKHYIWFKLYDDCYKDGNFIGTFILKRIEISYNDSDLEFKNKEFNAYKEYKLDNGTWESINYGTFIVQSVEESDTKEEIKVTGYDYGLKFANPYISELDYSSGTITLLQVLQECCTKCNVELATTEFANSGFLVDSNQFDGLSMFGNVVSAVAGISCNFAKIKADNKLYLEFKNETGIIIDVSDYEEFDDKRDTHPYNAVSLGMSAIEGENVTLVDEGVEPGKEKYLTINDNPFAYTQEKRNELIQAIFDKANGFGYSSFELNNCMYPQLECGDLIQVRNKEGQLVDTIVLRKSYEETEIKLEAPSTISATVTYQNPPSSYDIAKLTQINVNKQEQTIEAVVSQVEDNTEHLTRIDQNINEVSITVSETQKNVESQQDDISNLNSSIANTNNELNNIKNDVQNANDIVNDMKYTFTTDELKIQSSNDPINSALDNKGIRVYNYTTLKSVLNDKGSGFDDLIVTNTAQIGYLKFVKATDENGQPVTDIHHLVSNIQKVEDLLGDDTSGYRKMV